MKPILKYNQGNILSDLMEIIFNCDISEGTVNLTTVPENVL